jgi:hypothetical protein
MIINLQDKISKGQGNKTYKRKKTCPIKRIGM